MNESMPIGRLYPHVTPPAVNKNAAIPNKIGQTNSSNESFKQILQQNMSLKFSHHAEQRMKQRGIELLPEQMAKLASAVDKASQKGAKDSLLLLQDLALIVNVQSRMVITAMDGKSMQDNVFTNIDSAVVVS